MNQIINGNCIEVMATLPGNYIDLTVTSPPYDNLRDYNGYDFNFEGIANQLYRITKQGGVVVWVVGDATIKGSETGTSFRQALYFKGIGFNLHDTMIYEKGGFNYPPRYRYYQQFEYMFIFAKGNVTTFNPLMVERTGHVGYSVGTDKRGNKKTIEYNKDKTNRIAGNIWRINNHGKNASSDELAYQHPAIFPEKLANDHIISWSNAGDLILDPMCGSGTTCKMAMVNKRNYIGIDISEEYCEIARRRLAETELQQSII